MTAEQLANSIRVNADRLKLLLCCLIAAGLLRKDSTLLSNSAETDHFLVNGTSTYIGDMYLARATRWVSYFKTAQSIRTGIPQAKRDFSNSPQEELETFLRGINVNTVAAAKSLLEKYDFSSITMLADVGSGGGGLAITMAKACRRLRQPQ